MKIFTEENKEGGNEELSSATYSPSSSRKEYILS